MQEEGAEAQGAKACGPSDEEIEWQWARLEENGKGKRGEVTIRKQRARKPAKGATLRPMGLRNAKTKRATLSRKLESVAQASM